MSEADGARLAQLADELRHHLAGRSADELRALAASLRDRQLAGDRSDDLMARVLAAGREAIWRVTGTTPGLAVLEAVADGVGVMRVRPGRKESLPAIAMAAYWHSVAGAGVHIVCVDEHAAGHAWKDLRPVGLALGYDTGLVTAGMTGAERRAAYAADVTVGSCSELAADYLRDNLHDSTAEVVQRGLHVAVVADLGALAPTALSQVVITAPSRSAAESALARRFAQTFQRGADYRVDRKQRAIWFTPRMIPRLRQAVGLTSPPSAEAISAAVQVEAVIARREGLARPGGREPIAEVSLRGYLGAYDRLIAVSTQSAPTSVDEAFAAGDRAASPAELAFERVIDEQRTSVYNFRRTVRDAADPVALVQPVVDGAVAAWLANGIDELRDGLRDVLTGRWRPDQINEALSSPAVPGDIAKSASGLVTDAIMQRAGVVGQSAMAAVLREVLLTVVDLQWPEHLRRLRFLQRQAGALYHPALTPDGAAREAGAAPDAMAGRRVDDARHLFAAFEQTIRVESIKYALQVRV